MNTFFGNVIAASLGFACVVWFQWQHVEEKIDGLADQYGAPAEVQRVPITSGAPAEAAPTPPAAPANP